MAWSILEETVEASIATTPGSSSGWSRRQQHHIQWASKIPISLPLNVRHTPEPTHGVKLSVACLAVLDTQFTAAFDVTSAVPAYAGQCSEHTKQCWAHVAGCSVHQYGQSTHTCKAGDSCVCAERLHLFSDLALQLQSGQRQGHWPALGLRLWLLRWQRPASKRPAPPQDWGNPPWESLGLVRPAPVLEWVLAN